MTVYTAALLTGPARHRQKCRPTEVKIYFPTYIFPIILGLMEENCQIPNSLSAQKHS